MKRKTTKRTRRLVGGTVGGILLAAALVAVFWGPIFRGVVHPVYTRTKRAGFEKQAQSAQKGQVVFLGDSVVDSWPLAESLPGYTAYNLGIMGDATQHVLARLDDVYALRPSAIVLLVGTNDFINEDLSVQQAVEGYGRILAALRENCPSAQVLCLSLPPGYDSLLYKIEQWHTSLVEFNHGIESLAPAYGCEYVDIYPLLVDPATGLARREYCKDGLHPSPAGYALIAGALEEYLGPPG